MHKLLALAVAAALGASPALAAGATDLEAEMEVRTPAPLLEYELEKEMVVENWVLCMSEVSATALVMARVTSAEAARATYEELADKKICGQFAVLTVILRERVHRVSIAPPDAVLVFSAQVKLGGKWYTGLVVHGALE